MINKGRSNKLLKQQSFHTLVDTGATHNRHCGLYCVGIHCARADNGSLSAKTPFEVAEKLRHSVDQRARSVNVADGFLVRRHDIEQGSVEDESEPELSVAEAVKVVGYPSLRSVSSGSVHHQWDRQGRR